MSCGGFCEKEEVVWEVLWDGDYSLLMREIIWEDGKSKPNWMYNYPHDAESDKLAKEEVEAYKKHWLESHPSAISYPSKCSGDCVCDYDDTQTVVERYRVSVFRRYLVSNSTTLTGYITAWIKLKRTLTVSSGTCIDNPIENA